MANDHARDRYAPPKMGSDFDKDFFDDINIGEVKDGAALDIKEMKEVSVEPKQEIYVKS